MFYNLITKYIDIFVEKMREVFAVQKLLLFFQQKYLHIWDINIWNLNISLTNDIVSFEQPGPVIYVAVQFFKMNRYALMFFHLLLKGRQLLYSNVFLFKRKPHLKGYLLFKE